MTHTLVTYSFDHHPVSLNFQLQHDMQQLWQHKVHGINMGTRNCFISFRLHDHIHTVLKQNPSIREILKTMKMF